MGNLLFFIFRLEVSLSLILTCLISYNYVVSFFLKLLIEILWLVITATQMIKQTSLVLKKNDHV